MAIPLVGAAPVADLGKVAEHIEGDSRSFDSTVGNWGATGGTLSRDTSVHASYPYPAAVADRAASLKWVTTALNQHIDLPLAGTFKKGRTYTLLLLLLSDYAGTNGANGLTVSLGVQGGDVVAASATFAKAKGETNTLGWQMYATQWEPSGDRTGVSVRITRANSDSDTRNIWVGQARLVEGAPMPVLPGRTADTWLAPLSFELWTDYDANTGFQFNGVGNGGNPLFKAQTRDGPSGRDAGLYLIGADSTHDASASLWGAHATGDRVTTGGVNFEVGIDYIGLQMAEKNSTTIQVFPDFGDFDVELLDGHTSSDTKHWHAVTADGVRSKLGAWFQATLTVAGALTVGTDKAAHFQVPSNVRIDEVRCHVGTQPTGATILVDVNDDGTTIFTTQSHRPTIAVSTSNATSGTADGGTNIAKDSVISVDIDQVGSTIAGSDLTVFLRGRYIW